MRISKYHIILILMLLGRGIILHSQESRSEFCVDFRVNTTQIEPDYKDNASKISELVSFLRQVKTDSTIKITNYILLRRGLTEDSYEVNRRLAKGRMEALEKLVRGEIEIPDSVITYSVAEIDTSAVAPVLSDSSVFVEVCHPVRQTYTEDRWHHTLSVKTNALGLGVGISNAGIEIDLCKHLSFNLPLYYSAWNYFIPTVKFRTLAVQPELRYWFSGKKNHNDGWFAGAHFGLASYNVAVDGGYRIQDHDGECPALGGGLAVGYRLPISRNNRWKMEFSIGAGAYSLHYDKFHNYKNGLLASTGEKIYIGPDQASVSFSYTFDLKRKGGAR